MDKLQKIVPTPELLSEMEALEILGGEAGKVSYGECHFDTFSGNCVMQCGCTFINQCKKES